MPATPASVACLVSSTEWAVSLLVEPATTGTVTASRTARHSSRFSSSVRTGLSPVVPVTTRPSTPWSVSQRASRAAPSMSSAPVSVNGVAIAHATAPNRPTVAIGPKATRVTLVQVGDIEVTPVHDGCWWLDPGPLYERPEEEWLPHRQFLTEDGKLPCQIGGFLVQAGARRILVDTGAGKVNDPSGGQLLA